MTRTGPCLAAAFALALASCDDRSCLGDGDGCRIATPCAALAYRCAAGSVRVRRVADAPLPFGGPDVEGTGQDIVLENDRIAVVIDALDQPHDLAPSGGSIIDLAPIGGHDQLNQIYTVTGVLPDDAVRYTSLEIRDESPALVAVVARGVLDGRPAVRVATRYELRPCEPGVRVRTEIVSRLPDVQAFFLGDVSFWGDRSPLPFAVAPRQGFVQPELDLAELDDSWGRFPIVAARATAAPHVAYAVVGCSVDALQGVNDPQLSALGTARRVIRPGEGLVLERFILAAPGSDVASVMALAHEARTLLHGAEQPVRLSGRVVAGGAPFGGGETRASILVVRAGDRTPVTEIVPAADGRFAAAVLPAAYELEVWSFGRVVTRASVAVSGDSDAGDLAVPAPATLDLTLAGAPEGQAILVAADEATRRAVTGTQQGRFTACAPWLGPPHGGSPACNRVLVQGAATVEVPAGSYLVYGTIGPFATLARQAITVAEGQRAAVRLDVAPLALGQGASVDLHVHGRASFDSSIPDDDRVRAFLAAGVDVIAATDHDAVVDYGDAVARLGVGGRVRVIAGVETTGMIPFLHVPDDDFPRVIGHFNFYPVLRDPARPRGGAPWDELVEPGALFDRMDAVLAPGGLRMLNHPFDDEDAGRDLGYLTAIGYDPRVPVPALDDGTPAGMLARRPGGGHGNLDFQVLEVMNGRQVMKFQAYRAAWFSFLSQGHVYAGAANSDSHGLTDTSLGYPRNLLSTSRTVDELDEDGIIAEIRAGRMIGTNGPIIAASIAGRGPGLEPFAPAAGATLDLVVRAAPWIPVDELRLWVDGRLVRTIREGFRRPADPFGSDGAPRWEGRVPLAELAPPGRDAWIVVEAGIALPVAADLDDDGVVDTGDNDGDGVVDARDVEAGEDTGPLVTPPDPAPGSGDPREHVTALEPGAWPLAFTNPFLLDLDGDGGWTAPGLEPR